MSKKRYVLQRRVDGQWIDVVFRGSMKVEDLQDYAVRSIDRWMGRCVEFRIVKRKVVEVVIWEDHMWKDE